MAGRQQKIAVFSAGLRRLAAEVATLSSMTPCWPGPCDAVAGWGHKPTASIARHFARRFKKPYIRFEDGFLRSLTAGPAQKPSAMVMDRTGIYYDASGPSDLEALLNAGAFSDDDLDRAEATMAAIVRLRLSKYNDGVDAAPADLRTAKRVVVVIDQTLGDQSVVGALANQQSFRRMAEAALAENPGAAVVAKLHPEVVSGRKQGYLGAIARDLGIAVIEGNINPHALLDLDPRVYTVSSQFGFEAVLRGADVRCFGLPFYAGWGLTFDTEGCARRSRKASRRELAAAALVAYSRYFDCWTREPIDAVTAAEQLAFLRRQHFDNDRKLVVFGVARWKQRAIAAMATGPKGPPSFHRSLDSAIAEARGSGGRLAAWGRQALALRDHPSTMGLEIVAIEDGFLRSAGLGAAFVQPRSLVFDRRGIYYDPARPSDLEVLLAEGRDLDEKRGAALRARIVAAGLSKYNLAPDGWRPPARKGAGLLVIGQVEDDAAVLAMAAFAKEPARGSNRRLLAEVRRQYPDAFVLFRPHPDVVRMGRAGALAEKEDQALADVIVTSGSVIALLDAVDRVVTLGSLAGFEALIRGKAVSVHGMPFYAGWGLTDDRLHLHRRGARRTLDSLVAATLAHYPRYWDPESGLACPPETVVERLARAREPEGLTAAILRQTGRAVAIWRRLRFAAIRAKAGSRGDGRS